MSGEELLKQWSSALKKRERAFEELMRVQRLYGASVSVEVSARKAVRIYTKGLP